VAQLPSCYCDEPPVTIPSTELCAQKISGRFKFHPIISELGKEEEKDWLQNVKGRMQPSRNSVLSSIPCLAGYHDISSACDHCSSSYVWRSSNIP